MIFIRNGIHMIALKEGSILKIRPNPKFTRDNVAYGAIMLDTNIIGVYPLSKKDEYTDTTVYTVWADIQKQINRGDIIINLPLSYEFKSDAEWKEYNELVDKYDPDEMFKIFYDTLATSEKS